MQKKRLVVCFDGTWNSADSEGDETNVARIAGAIRANSGDDGIPQLCLYLRGVGTSGTDLDRLIAGATGEGIEDTIRAGYRFLAQNYVPARVENGVAIPADEIFLFGYSRGAFAARSLSGWLGATGLLKRQSLAFLPAAWTFYRTARDRRPEVFRKRYQDRGIDLHEEVAINFLGVWDTVGALGIPVGILGAISAEVHGFHNTEPSRIVRYGAHALAVDEHRDPFVPTLWTGTLPEDSTIEQVWFAGAHADVGGGYRNRRLADIPLAWMAERAESQGLQLDWSVLPDRAAADARALMHNSRSGWSGLDLTPTIRCVCERSFDVTPFERMYRPTKGQRILRTINESIHPSLVERWGRKVAVMPHDEGTRSRESEYATKNLTPFFRPDGAPKPGVPLWQP